MGTLIVTEFVIGSLDLFQSLLGAELVDELNLWVYPVLLGPGKRAFEPGVLPTALTLTKSVTYPAVTVNLVFSTGGRPSVGDMTAQEDLSRTRSSGKADQPPSHSISLVTARG